MTTSSDESCLPAEARARMLIDAQLRAAGWAVQDGGALNLFAGQGIAVREVVMAPGHGRVDYLLYVDKQVVGVIEASLWARHCPGSNGSRRCTQPGSRTPTVSGHA